MVPWKNVSLILVQDGHLSHGCFKSPVSRKKRGGQNALLAPAFNSALAQNNPSAKVPYFGIAYSVTLHHAKISVSIAFKSVCVCVFVQTSAPQKSNHGDSTNTYETIPQMQNLVERKFAAGGKQGEVAETQRKIFLLK